MKGAGFSLSMVISVMALAYLPAQAHAADDNRAMFTAFVDRFYTQRDVAGAFAEHVGPNYIQHNPGLADGPAAAIEALAPMFARPEARFEVRQMLVDGDLAMVQLFGQGRPDTPGAAVADIYRIDKGRVVEHWDVIQPVAKESDPLQIAKAAAPASRRVEEVNRKAFAKFVDLLFHKKQVKSAFERFVAPDLIQHNMRLGRGRDGSIKALSALFANPASSFAVHHVLVDGNLAAVHYKGQLSPEDRGTAVVEIFRFDDGKIVEHWDMSQPIPMESANPHPMF